MLYFFIAQFCLLIYNNFFCLSLTNLMNLTCFKVLILALTLLIASSFQIQNYQHSQKIDKLQIDQDRREVKKLRSSIIQKKIKRDLEQNSNEVSNNDSNQNSQTNEQNQTHDETNQNQNLDTQSHTQENKGSNDSSQNQSQFNKTKWSDHGKFNRQGKIQINGFSFRCAFGCRNCSNLTNPLNCSACLDGFALDQTAFTCLKCDDLCVNCQSSNVKNCTSCYPGWTLKKTDSTFTCVKCSDQHCGNCSAESTCVTCKNSYFLASDNSCKSCIDNCKNCSNSTTCNQCFNGYFINTLETGSQQCSLCSDGCAFCSNITKCDRCYPGFFLNSTSNICQKCSPNCWNCTSSTNCTRCTIGNYQLNGTCVQQIDYCATLNSNNTCNTCFWGYKKNSNQSSCVDNDTQTTIQQKNETMCKMNHFRKGSQCKSCNGTIANCQDCNSTSNSTVIKCMRCMRGYVSSSDGTACNACSSTLVGCQQCENTIFCSRCQSGYYMEQDINDNYIMSYGQCIKCNQNCLTCNQKDVYCTSCNSGFSLTTSRTCVPQNQFNFTLLLNLDINKFSSKMNSFKSQMKKLIKDPQASSAQLQNFIQIAKVSSGSVKIQGTAYATSQSAIDSTKQNFESTLTVGNTFNGVQILSTSLAKTQYQSNNSEGDGGANVGLIVGIVVGVIAAIVIGGIIVYCFCIKKKQGSIQRNLNQKKTVTTVDDFVVLQTIQSDQNIQKPGINYPSLPSQSHNREMQL